MKKTKLLLLLLSVTFVSGCTVHDLSSKEQSFENSTSTFDKDDLYSYYGTFHSLQEVYFSGVLTDDDMTNICYRLNNNRVLDKNGNQKEYDSNKIKEIAPISNDISNKILHDYYNVVMCDGCNIEVDYNKLSFKSFGTYSDYILLAFSGAEHTYIKDAAEYKISLGDFTIIDYPYVTFWKLKTQTNNLTLPTTNHGTFKTIQELYSSNELSDDDLYNIYYYNEKISGNSDNDFDQNKIKIKEPLSSDVKRKIVDDYYLYVTSDKCKVKVDYESIRLAYYSGTYNGYVISMVLAPHDNFKIDNNFISKVNVSDYSIKTLTTTCDIYGWKIN